jgi:Cu2+-exporting ATPase
MSHAAILDDELESSRFTRWATNGDGVRTGESALRIGGMHCAACAGIVLDAIRRTPGVIDASVSAAARVATVTWDRSRTSPSALVNAIERAGYQASPDTAVSARKARQAEQRQALWRLFVAAFCSMQVMMLATPAYLSGPDDLAPDLKRLLDWASWLLSVPVLLWSASPFFQGALRSLRQRRIGMDVPVALGIAIAFVASSGAAFDPGGWFGVEVYFDSLTMFVAFLLGGRFLEMRLRHRAERELEESIAQLPQAVVRIDAAGQAETISALRIARGDVLRVAAGEVFAADGTLTQGRTEASEAILSGEATPVPKEPGDAVIAGSINLGAPVLMVAERLGADTRYEQILALMREAQSRRTATLQVSDRWAAPFLWTVLLLAAAAGGWWAMTDPHKAVWVVVSVLIVTCPCALSLAAPSALLSCASLMARRGLLLRRLDAIEGLARMDTLFTDKTGTLTRAELQLAQLDRLGGAGELDDTRVLEVAASLGAWSSHPLARSLARCGARVGVDSAQVVRHGWTEVRDVPGQGLEGREVRLAQNGQAEQGDPPALWRLGSAPWVGAVQTVGPDDTGSASDTASVWLARDGQPVARFTLTEALRNDARASVQALAADGVKVVLLSGDEQPRVETVAAQVGAASAHWRMTPEDKLATVAMAQARGHVVGMLGDGVNDAPVLAQADVSIAMGEGAGASRAQADAVLLSNGLAQLGPARRAARKALRIARQNMLWAAGYNAACVPLALAGWMPPWAAGLGMACSSLMVVLNSLRAGR